MRRRWLAAAGMAVALLTAGCERPGGVDGDLTNGWSAPNPAATFHPRALICHESASATGSIAHYRPVDCGERHYAETIHVSTVTGDQFPRPKTGRMNKLHRDCSERATSFLGAPWRTGRVRVDIVLPTPAAWSGGARWYRCDVSEITGQSLDARARQGSLADALTGRSPLRLGCFKVRVKGGAIRKQTQVSCRSKHQAEFAGLWTAPAGLPHSAVRRGDEKVRRGCLGVIAKYVGVPNDSMVKYRSGMIAWAPLPGDWRWGERRVQCYIWLNGRTLTRSLKGGGTRALPINYA